MPKRILVYGVTGSGKTTLAEEISVRTGLAWYSVDVPMAKVYVIVGLDYSRWVSLSRLIRRRCGARFVGSSLATATPRRCGSF